MKDLELDQEVFISYVSTFKGIEMMKSVLGKVTKVTPKWYAVSYGMHTQWVNREGIRKIHIH